MEILNSREISDIAEKFFKNEEFDWSITPYSNEPVGGLGEHYSLKIFSKNNPKEGFRFFVKTLPIKDKWKADYIRSMPFFEKEYGIYSELMVHFRGDEDPDKWRPKLFFIKREVLVFEDLRNIGYEMPDKLKTFTYDQMTALVKAMAKFHVQSYVFENKKSIIMGRPYRIWEDHRKLLEKQTKNLKWRTAGRNLVYDILKEFSEKRFTEDFNSKVEKVITQLYDKAHDMMQPDPSFRNVVIHRDLWANNIMFKKDEDGSLSAVLIDYQTVLYASPMIDLSSAIYMNSSRNFRDHYLSNILDLYYDVISKELRKEGIKEDEIFTKTEMIDNYNKSIVFGLTQAALIVPITSLDKSSFSATFEDENKAETLNFVSRSAELIAVARKDENYKCRLMGICEEFVERFLD